MTPLTTLALALAPLCAGCSSTQAIPYHDTVEQVPEVLAGARAELDAGPGEAESSRELVDRLRSARAVQDLPSETRQEVKLALDQAAARYIEQEEKPKALKRVMDYDLPRRLSVEAGIRAAQLYYADRERMKSFRLVRDVDSKFPQHHMRREAGRLLSEVGLDLANDPRRYGLFFRYRTLGIQVLEYFVHEYPSDPSGDVALVTLAEIYEEQRDFGLAIERHQNLLLWFPESTLAADSEAEVPRLRLASLGSPEHDRSTLEVAREELDRWLDQHADHPKASDVRLHRIDCLQRLADNDLVVARFYRTVKNPYGAEYHARRALAEAQDGGDPDQVKEAEELLRKVAPRLEEAEGGA